MALPNPNITVITTTDLVLGDTSGTPLSGCGGPANIPHKEIQENIDYLYNREHYTDLEIKTSNYTITSLDSSKSFINTGASSLITYTLPSLPPSGFNVTIINRAESGTLIVAPSGATLIKRNNATSVYNTVLIPQICVEAKFTALNSTEWDVEGFINDATTTFPRGNLSFVPLLSQTLGLPFYNNRNSTYSLPGPSGADEGCFDGQNIWICNSTQNSVFKLDTRNPALSASISVGSFPDFALFDGKYIWVTNNQSGNVSKINSLNNTVEATITVGSLPDGIAFNGIDEIWVNNNGGNTISVININSHAVTTISSLGSSLGLKEICFDGTSFWSTCKTSNELKKINASSKTLETTISLPASASPEGICFDGQNIWVTDNSSVSRIFKYDTVTLTSSGSISLTTNDYPHGICFDGRNIWVACQGPSDGSVNKILKVDPHTLTYITLTMDSGTRPKGIFYDGQFIWATLSSVNKLKRIIP